MMAHELAHVQHRDTLTMTITATFAGAISMLAQFRLLPRRQPRQQRPFGFVGVAGGDDRGADCRHDRADGGQPHAANTRPTGAAPKSAAHPLWLASALAKIARGAAAHSQPRCRSAIRRRRICSSSIPCPASAWTACSRPTRAPTTASPRLQAMAREMAGDGASRDRAASGAGAAAGGGTTAVRPMGQASATRTPAEPEKPKPNPWGRNPTGPKGRWS